MRVPIVLPSSAIGRSHLPKARRSPYREPSWLLDLSPLQGFGEADEGIIPRRREFGMGSIKSYTTGFCMAIIVGALLVAPNITFATPILGATSVSSSSPLDVTDTFFGDFAIKQTIDQSGLSANYVSAVTDFDSFVATTTAGNFEKSIGGRSGLPDPVLFDYSLGSTSTVDAIAIWNQQGSAALNNFSLFVDILADFSTATLIGTFDADRMSQGCSTLFTWGESEMPQGSEKSP